MSVFRRLAVFLRLFGGHDIGCFFFLPTQDYASLSHLRIVVTASLVLHSAAENMVLQTPYTEVSSSSFVLKNKLMVSQLYSMNRFHMHIYIFIFYMSNVKIFYFTTSTLDQQSGILFVFQT